MSPWGKAIRDLLSDGQWWSRAEIQDYAMPCVPIGIASRAAENWRRAKKIGTNPNSVPVHLMGARSKINAALWGGVRRGTFEQRAGQFRLAERCLQFDDDGAVKPTLDVSSYASVRRSDPWTSWDAARSVNLTKSQRIVLGKLRAYGEDRTWIDEELVAAIPELSQSGVRTRRKELTGQGYIRFTGQTRPMTTGRQAHEYRFVEHDAEVEAS